MKCAWTPIRPLIGGMVIFAGGFRYDYSIKGQLSRIVTKLKTQKSIGAEGEETDNESMT